VPPVVYLSSVELPLDLLTMRGDKVPTRSLVDLTWRDLQSTPDTAAWLATLAEARGCSAPSHTLLQQLGSHCS